MTFFKKTINIEGKKIGQGKPCYIIAEGGVNHFGDINKAFRLIDAAVAAGADAYKTQHFRTKFLISHEAPELRERFLSKELKDHDILVMRDYCAKKGISFLCTAHDEYALEFLSSVKLPAYKIGSGEVENWPFIKKFAALGKPVILSVGMYTEEQIKYAIGIFKKAKNPNLAILHCHTGYPSFPLDINLLYIEKIKKFFNGPIGYSDHTIGTAISLASIVLGANIIEKHITIDKNVPNAHDWIVSCDPKQLKQFVKDIRSIEEALGDGKKVVTNNEKKSLLWARKSIVASRKIIKGTLITREMLTIKRPGKGLSPRNIDKVIGRTTLVDIKEDTLIHEEDLS